MSLLVLKDVSKIYGSRKALDGFSLRVREKERVALLGPSGCGKTTALRLLAGFEAPDFGQVEIGGVPAALEGRILLPSEARSLGMVFQDLALWPHFTVRGNLEFGLKAKGIPAQERQARIREMLERVELLEYADAKPSALSGGQQQRVAFARALALRPRALLMDEPLSSLDEDLNLKLREEILQLHQEYQFALLYVTHDRREACALAERVVVMKQGKMEMVGSREEVCAYLEAQARNQGHW